MMADPTEFHGYDLDTDQCELLANSRWPVKLLRAEPSLYGLKWWDYRAEHFVISTYRFAHIFTQEVRGVIRAHLDPRPPKVTASGRVLDWEPIKAGDILEPPAGKTTYWSRKITGLIKARQFADQWGIPYPQFLRAGVRRLYFGRYMMHEAQSLLPEPNLLTGEIVSAYILERWAQTVEGTIQHATHPRYRIGGGDLHPDVAAHERWLLDQCARKPDPRFALRNLIRDGWLSRDAAITRFGVHRVM